MNLFEEAYRLLLTRTAPVDGKPISSCEDHSSSGSFDEATRLLCGLGYLQSPNETSGKQPTASCVSTLKNRLALLKLASKFERMFQLPLAHAPGASFLGAVVDPKVFGISGHESVGVAGRGLTFRRTFESCVGEAAEYLSFIEHDNELLFRCPSASSALSEENLAWVLAGLGVESDAEMVQHDWVRMYSLHREREICFPAELVVRRSATKRKATRQAESNGVGAGVTQADACLSALFEVIERDAIALWWYAGQPAREVSAGIAEAVGKFVAIVRAGSRRQCWLLDLTTDLDVPVFAAITAEVDGRKIVAGFSAHLDPIQAAKSAVLEACQMELAQEVSVSKMDRGSEALLNDKDRKWIERHRYLEFSCFPQFAASAPARRYDIDDLSRNSPLSSVLSKLSSAGYEAFRYSLTRQVVGISVARVLVPGLQSAKPDWISDRLKRTAVRYECSLKNIESILTPI